MVINTKNSFRIGSLVMALMLVLSSFSFALESDDKANSDIFSLISDERFVNEQMTRIEEEYSISPKIDEKKSVYFQDMVEDGLIYVNEAGLVEVEITNNLELTNEIKSDFELFNYLASMGLYEIDADFSVVINYEKFLANANLKDMVAIEEILPKKACDEFTNTKDTFDNGVTLMASHSCSYTKVSFGTMVINNRDQIIAFYNELVWYQMQYGIQTEPYISSVAYWVGLVQPKGSWDYKVKSPYNGGKTLCLTYAGGTNVHKASGGEYMGNYNFGYTGKFLFSLNALKTGSWAIGFLSGNLTNEYEDVIVITEGYNAAP